MHLPFAYLAYVAYAAYVCGLHGISSLMALVTELGLGFVFSLVREGLDALIIQYIPNLTMSLWTL